VKGLLMNSRNSVWWLSAALAVLCAPANAEVSIAVMTPALKPPQQIGANVRWTATATGANSGPLTFQWLADGNYLFLPAIVVTGNVDTGYDIQIQPTPGTDTGIQVINVAGPSAYRGWQMPNLYSPPTT